MDDNRVYQIRVRGGLAEADIEPFSPPGLRLAKNAAFDTLLVVCTDQSGMIGLLRNLHNLGVEILAIESGPVNIE